MGAAKCVGCCRRIRPERGYDRACGGDRRRRSDGADVGGRVGVGGRRRCHRRAARQPGPRRLARRRSAITHHRGPRPAWHRRSVPLGGTGGAGRGVRQRPVGHQRLSDPAQLRARAVAEPHRADPGRLGRRAGGARSIYGIEVTGFAQDDTGVDVELSDGQSVRAAVPRRVRRRTQSGPQGSRHRVPRLGCDHELPDRPGRDDRGA